MLNAIRAEWFKLRTVTSTLWLLIGFVVITIAMSAGFIVSIHGSPQNFQNPVKLSLAGMDIGQAVIAVFAILNMSEEYGTGMIRITIIAIPRRSILLLAKAVNVAALTAVGSFVMVAGSLTIGHWLLLAHGYSPVTFNAPTVRAAFGSVIYLMCIALLSLGVTTAMRDTAVSIAMVLGLLYVPPILAQLVSGSLRTHLLQISPMNAGLSILATTHLQSLPITPWAGLGVLGGWAALTLWVGGVVIRWRNV